MTELMRFAHYRAETVPAGGCPHNDHRRGSRYSGPTAHDATPATRLVVVTHDKFGERVGDQWRPGVKEWTVSCVRHTTGMKNPNRYINRNGSQAVIEPLPEGWYSSGYPEQRVAELAKDVRAGVSQLARERRAYIEANRAKVATERLKVRDASFAAKLAEPDEYGHRDIHVSIYAFRDKLTPGSARALAAKLIELADEAE